MRILKTLLRLPVSAAAGIGSGAGFSRKTDQVDRAVSGRRAQRHHRARGRPAHVGTDEATGRDRQSRRTGRGAGHRRGRESRARRLHHRIRERERTRHQPLDGESRLRRDQGLRAGHPGRDGPGNAGGRKQRSRKQHGRTGRAREGAARQTQFRLRRRRRPRIWRANCSNSPRRSTSCMCPIAEPRLRSTTCSASRCR